MPDEIWLATIWPFVSAHLPEPPGRIIEIGCGPLGGFVPRMRTLGYDAVGVDPEAPVGADYAQVGSEDYDVREPLDAVVACTSLHHVADLEQVLDRIERVMRPGGRVVVVEWAHERFDEMTARWCFERLGADEDSWLRHHRDHWQESGKPWDEYFQGWIGEEHLHTGRDILRGLNARFDTQVDVEAPYVFAELADLSIADEQAAIDAELIQATGLRYVGRRR